MITKKDRSENAFEDSQRALKTLMGNLPGIAYRCRNDEEWTIEFISDGCRALTGYLPEDLIGNRTISYARIIHPDDREMVWNMVQEALSGKNPFKLIYRIICRSGQEKWVWEQGCGVYAESGELAALEGFITDISERKRAEEELDLYREKLEKLVTERTFSLQEANEKLTQEIAERQHVENTLQHILDVFPDSITMLDENLRIIWASQGTSRLFGLPAQEFTGKACYELWHNLSEPCEKCYARESLATSNMVCSYVTSPDGRIWDTRAFPLRDENGKVNRVMTIGRDVTREKRMMEEAMKIEKLESIGLLSGGIAHDFNNILTAIVSKVTLARISLKSDASKALGGSLSDVLDYLKDVEKVALQAKDLSRQLLVLSKGGTPMKKASSIEDILMDCVGFALSGSNVECIFCLADDLWPVNIDVGQISQVIHNLVINADQAMPKGGTINIKAENILIAPQDILSLEPGRYVKIEISDNGEGIDPVHLSRIFDPYFSTRKTGSGLGLATAYSIIKGHRGHIEVKSKPGAGASFLIHLPASEINVLPEEIRKKNDVPMGKGRVLIMDDEIIILLDVKNLLERFGFEVETASDGEEALHKYKDFFHRGKPFDAVVIDLTVRGGMGGRECIRELVAFDPEVKAIVASGYSTDPVIADYQSYGFKGVVTKPYQVQDIINIFNKEFKMDRK